MSHCEGGRRDVPGTVMRLLDSARGRDQQTLYLIWFKIQQNQVPGCCEYQNETKKAVSTASNKSGWPGWAIREAVTGTEGSAPPPGKCPAIPGVTTSVLCKMVGLEQQLENQLSRPCPPRDTRAAPQASWSALNRATTMEQRGNNHLYRHNILLQKSA